MASASSVSPTAPDFADVNGAR
jgi:hypothetical protein